MWRRIAGALAGLVALAAAPPAITDLRPVTLHPGINRVSGFLAGGGTATIVEAWRGNGNAHGYRVWTVLGGRSEGKPVGLVDVAGDDRENGSATVRDDPFDGERVLGAVRFALARIGRRPATLLIRADLDGPASGIAADHAPATVRWFRLDHDPAAIGRPTDEFVPIGRVVTAKRYCNAGLALRDVAGLALPAGFAGANRVDGCSADG